MSEEAHGIALPPEVADYLAHMDEREDEIRERLLRMSQTGGPVDIPIIGGDL